MSDGVAEVLNVDVGAYMYNHTQPLSHTLYNTYYLLVWELVLCCSSEMKVLCSWVQLCH